MEGKREERRKKSKNGKREEGRKERKKEKRKGKQKIKYSQIILEMCKSRRLVLAPLQKNKT